MVPRRKVWERDPFIVIGAIPKGKSYQWCTREVLGKPDYAERQWQHFRDAGWKPVPSKRHPKMPRHKGQIVYGGQVLCERPASVTDKAAADDRDRARALKTGDEAQPSSDGYRYLGGATPVDYHAQTQAVRTEIEEAGGSVAVEINIELRETEIEAAGLLGLTAREYARRKVLLLEQISDAVVLRELRPGVFQFAPVRPEITVRDKEK